MIKVGRRSNTPSLLEARTVCSPSEALYEDIDARVQHISRDVQSRNVSQCRLSAGEKDQAVLVRVLCERVSDFRIRLLRPFVRDELRGLHQTQPATVADEFVTFLHLVEALRQVLD